MTPRNFHISIYSNARSQFFRWRQNVVFRRVANELVNVLWLGVFSHDFERNLRRSLDYSILVSNLTRQRPSVSNDLPSIFL